MCRVAALLPSAIRLNLVVKFNLADLNRKELSDWKSRESTK